MALYPTAPSSDDDVYRLVEDDEMPTAISPAPSNGAGTR